MILREEERRANFKKTVDLKDGRRRREETTRQIRKNKREENLRKRRQATPMDETPSIVSDSSISSCSSTSSSMAPMLLGGTSSTCNSAQTKKKLGATSEIPQLASILLSQTSNRQQLVEATRGFRRMLSVEDNPPVDAVLETGIIHRLIHNLSADPTASVLIYESAWTLTNIASTARTKAVLDAGGVRPLIQLLTHKNADVREQSAWCLGNIAGEGTEYRDHLLSQNILEPILLNIQQPNSMSLMGNVTWTLSNLCRGKPAPHLDLVAPAIDVLAALLTKEVSTEVLVDAVWALSYLSDGPDERIERVMSTGVTPTLVGFLEDKSSPLLTPTIRCLGNFVTGSDAQTQAVVDAGILNHLVELLENPSKSIKKETCWLASNITAGTHQQINKLMRQPGLLDRLVENARDAAWETRKEALWSISNICTTGRDDQVQALIQREGVQSLVEALSVQNADARVLVACLDGIEKVMEVGERQGLDYGRLIDEYNGIDYLENLQEHPSDMVYRTSVRIIEKYFGGEEEEDMNLAPTMTSSGTFGFGMSTPAKELFPTDVSSNPAPMTFQFGDVSNTAY